MRTLSVGSITIDEIVFHNGRLRLFPGGGAFYGAMASLILGAKPSIASAVGPDFPNDALRWMKARGVDTKQVDVDTSARTTRFHLEYKRDKRKLSLVDPGPGVRIRDRHRGKFNLIHLAPVYHELDTKTVGTCRDMTKLLGLDIQGLVRGIDKSGKIRLQERSLGKFLRKCDVVKASVEEAQAITQKDEPVDMAHVLTDRGPAFSIVGLGRRGVIIADRVRKQVLKVPAYFERGLADSTGAGDAMFAAWLVTYYRTRDVAWSAAVGNALSSLIIRGTGRSRFRVSMTELYDRAAEVHTGVRKF